MLKKVYELNPEIAFRLNVESENISGKAFNSDTEILHEFNDQATEILNLIDEHKTIQEILKLLQEKYDIEEKMILEDLESFIIELENLNVIQAKE